MCAVVIGVQTCAIPIEPEGVWMTVYNGAAWKESEGEDQYRRGVYTFIKRTSPYPSFVTFDGSSREVGVVDRIRPNTPLQALTTLNAPVYLERSDERRVWQELDRTCASRGAPFIK